jgi:hypothetical protein
MIREFDGKENLLALLLSADLAVGIIDALCAGRNYKALRTSSAAGLTTIEQRRVKTIAQLQSAEFLPNQCKKQTKKPGTKDGEGER